MRDLFATNTSHYPSTLYGQLLGFTFVFRTPLGLDSNFHIRIVNESSWERRLIWFDVNRLLRGLKGPCSISSIVTGLVGKCFDQFLFHKFELSSIFRLTKGEDLIL